MKKVLSGFLLMAAAGCAAAGCAGDDGVVVYTGPVFVTGDPAQPIAAAVSVDRAGKIVGVHAEVPAAGEVDLRVLPGVLALPGLHDAHLHLAGIGRLFEEIDLGGAVTVDEARGRVADFAAAHPGIAVLQGRGWDQNRFPGRRYPTWKDLDEIGERPVYLRRIDGHAAWVNRPMLALAGIDAGTPDPDGGRILHDEDGEPTGILIDNAVDLVLDILPEPSAADRERWLLAGAEACAEAGLVAAHDMGLTGVDVAALSRLDAAGELPLRVFGYLEGSEPGILDLLDHVSPGDRFEIAGVKFYADGALGSRGATGSSTPRSSIPTISTSLSPPERWPRCSPRIALRIWAGPAVGWARTGSSAPMPGGPCSTGGLSWPSARTPRSNRRTRWPASTRRSRARTPPDHRRADGGRSRN